MGRRGRGRVPIAPRRGAWMQPLGTSRCGDGHCGNARLGGCEDQGRMPTRPRTTFPIENGPEVPTGPLSASEAASQHQQRNGAPPLALQLPRPVPRALYPAGMGPTGAADTEPSWRVRRQEGAAGGCHGNAAMGFPSRPPLGDGDGARDGGTHAAAPGWRWPGAGRAEPLQEGAWAQLSGREIPGTQPVRDLWAQIAGVTAFAQGHPTPRAGLRQRVWELGAAEVPRAASCASQLFPASSKPKENPQHLAKYPPTAAPASLGSGWAAHGARRDSPSPTPASAA